VPKIISERYELVKLCYVILIIAVQFFGTVYILMRTMAFAPFLSLSWPTAPPFSHLRCSDPDLDLDLDLPKIMPESR